MKLFEIRPGFHVNLDQIVSVRVLPEPEGQKFAVLQLANGENQNVTKPELEALMAAMDSGVSPDVDPDPPQRSHTKSTHRK